MVGDTDYCDYPPDAQKKPKVGGGINPNLEVIASLHPDLVLVTNSFNRLDTVRALDTLGIPSYDVDPHTVTEIISSTEKLADILGVPDTGKNLANELQHRLAALQTKLASVPQTRVLFIVWAEPLISVGKDTFIADALRKAGANSVVESSQDWPQMNLEEVVRLQPDYLIFAASHSAAGAHDFDSLSIKPGWRLMDAVHNRRFAVISDAVNRPAPRIVSAIEDLARQLHPSAFQDSPANEKEAVPQNRMNPSHVSFDLPESHSFPDIARSTVTHAPTNARATAAALRCARGDLVCRRGHRPENGRRAGFALRPGQRSPQRSLRPHQRHLFRLRHDRDGYPPAQDFAWPRCRRFSRRCWYEFPGSSPQSPC